MKNKSNLLAFIAGTLGGMLTLYMTPPSAFAQNLQSTGKEIKAQGVSLFTVARDGQRAVLRDSQGHEIRRARGNKVETFIVAPGGRRIAIRNSQGRQIWRAAGSTSRNLPTR